MADRSWFYSSQGQQEGPYPEAQLHDLVIRGIVRADTLVWTEGMSGWQKAGDIPGLVSGGSGPPSIPQSGGPVMSAGSYGGGALSVDLPIWSFFGRALLYVIGTFVVIPLPWIVTSIYRWFVSRLHVPGRPNLAFNGRVGDIWYVFIVIALLVYGGIYSGYIQLIGIVIQGFLSWMIVRWVAGNLSSNDQPLPIAFNGSPWVFIGWQVALYLSFITIIGWAWVTTAMTRWICRNVGGTRREAIFNGSGLEVLWRTIVFAIGCIFIIPIPWLLRWYINWYVSQFALVDRTV
jgi:GYF domain 2